MDSGTSLEHLDQFERTASDGMAKKNYTSVPLERKQFKQICPNNLLRFLQHDKAHWATSARFQSKPECLAEAVARNIQMSLWVLLWILKLYIFLCNTFRHMHPHINTNILPPHL